MKKIRQSKPLIRILLTVWALIQLFPLYWLFAFSLKSNEEIFGANVIGLPKEFIWENYRVAIVGDRKSVV